MGYLCSYLTQSIQNVSPLPVKSLLQLWRIQSILDITLIPAIIYFARPQFEIVKVAGLLLPPDNCNVWQQHIIDVRRTVCKPWGVSSWALVGLKRTPKTETNGYVCFAVRDRKKKLYGEAIRRTGNPFGNN